MQSRSSVVASRIGFALSDAAAFRSTAGIVADFAGRMAPGFGDLSSLSALRAVAEGKQLQDDAEQHAAVCAFLDCLEFISEQRTPTPETYAFVAKCSEYNRYLDQKVVEYRANPRGTWATQSLTSDNNEILAKVVDEIATHLRSFSDPAQTYQGLVDYTQARIRALIPAEIADMRQEANIALILPFLEKALTVTGDVAEFGCFRGILSVKLAWMMKAMGVEKHYYAFDTFHGFEIDDPAGGALGIGAFRDDAFNAFNFLTQWSRILPLTPIKGDATKTCAQLSRPLSFVWLDLDMGVLMDPVLRKIWPLCGSETLIGIDDVGRPETPTVAPWLDGLIAAGALELVFNSDEIAPNTFIRFAKKKGGFPEDYVGSPPRGHQR